MIFRTGYFAKQKLYESNNLLPISIALYPPTWYDGLKAYGISPSAELLKKHKNGQIDEESFEKEYFSKLNINVVTSYISSWTDMCNSLNKDGVVLLCFEKSGDFCHRHLLAKFIKEKLDIAVEEF